MKTVAVTFEEGSKLYNNASLNGSISVTGNIRAHFFYKMRRRKTQQRV